MYNIVKHPFPSTSFYKSVRNENKIKWHSHLYDASVNSLLFHCCKIDGSRSIKILYQFNLMMVTMIFTNKLPCVMHYAK